MDHEQYKELMMGYLDKELSAEQEKLLHDHLSSCTECRQELDRYGKLVHVTSGLRLPEPEDEFWERYWGQVYNRMERRLGWWLLVSGLGAVVFIVLDYFFMHPGLSLALKIGGGVFLLGFIVLFISVLREQVNASRHERYGEIKR